MIRTTFIFFLCAAAASCAPKKNAANNDSSLIPGNPLADDAAPRPEHPPAGPPPTIMPAPDRLVAIGDVHGDYDKTISALKIARVIDDSLNWNGGKTIVVQVGDQLDRGAGERLILDLFEKLALQAYEAGGGLYPLLGNHEIMNVEEDYRYVTTEGWEAFADIPYNQSDERLARYEDYQKPRVAAFIPKGSYAQILARHNLTMVVGSTLFVHGGILPVHAVYGLERMNEETQQWIRGEIDQPTFFSGDFDPVWSRHYSDGPDAADCNLAQNTLLATNTKRIVVAHTVQINGINTACDGIILRVDVGISNYYGGPTEVLEIRGDQLTVLDTLP